MDPHQTLRDYMHLCNAHLICLIKNATIAYKALLKIFHNVVVGIKMGE